MASRLTTVSAKNRPASAPVGGAPIAGSASSVPYGDLAQNINQMMTSEAAKPLIANLPGYNDLITKRSGNIQNDLSGILPDDVVSQILQTGAERGILTGSALSPNSNAAMLRALGLNSLQLRQQGSQNLSQAIADTPVPQLFSPASLIVPTTLAQMELDAARQGAATPAMSTPTQNWNDRGGGIQYNMPAPTPWNPIPRTNYGPTIAYGATGPVQDYTAQSTSPNEWWTRDVNDTSQWPMYASQGYWNSPEGLQNPNRPADEPAYAPFDDLYSSFETDDDFWNFFNDGSNWGDDGGFDMQFEDYLFPQGDPGYEFMTSDLLW